MKKKEIRNKKGEVYTSEEGKPLVEYRLEEGDEFVPQFNTVFENTREVEIDGKKKNITNFSIKVKARDKEGNLINDGEDIFIALTPTQAKTLIKKEKNGVELNQTLFKAYKYENNFGENIGVGEKKDFKKPKTFKDFDRKK